MFAYFFLCGVQWSKYKLPCKAHSNSANNNTRSVLRPRKEGDTSREARELKNNGCFCFPGVRRLLPLAPPFFGAGEKA